MQGASKPSFSFADDEMCWADGLVRELGELGLDVAVYRGGGSDLESASVPLPDVILLDTRRHGMDQYEACGRLRKAGFRGAVFICSAHDTTVDMVLTHKAEADEHVSKAAELAVLQTRIQRAMLHTRGNVTLPPRRLPARLSGIRDLFRDIKPVPPVDWSSLSGLDERLLCVLACARGEVVPAQSLLLEGWGRADLPVSRLYEPISRLRDKVRPHGWTIRNARGQGYRLEREAADRGGDAG